MEVQATANPTVYTREGVVTIAGQAFSVIQEGLNASVEFDAPVLGTDGGSGFIQVSTEGNGQWQAISNDTWLTVATGAQGVGSGSVFFVANPFTQLTSSRVGSITVAGQEIFVTQRGYELSISPEVAQVGSNAGAGEIGVAAPIGAIWEAIVTEPWITLIGGVDGVGNGTVRYSVSQNTTGFERTGRIIIAGEEYTVTQTTTVIVDAEAASNGTVEGAGNYAPNAIAVLTATPDAGYVFSHWTGDGVGSANPLNLLVDTGKTVTANFIPEGAAQYLAEASAAGLGLVPLADVTADPAQYGLLSTEEVIANPGQFGLISGQEFQALRG